MALPCRISLYEEGGVHKLAMVKPTTLIDLYSTPGPKAVAQEVEATLEAIMAEAACQRMGASSESHAMSRRRSERGESFGEEV